MRTRTLTVRFGVAALTFTALALAGQPSFAAEYWLRAAATTVCMPNPNGALCAVPNQVIAMWGYAKCTDNFASCTDPITVPGPALTVPAGETTLTVHLRNDLGVPTSLVINGLTKAMTPVWDSGATGARPNLAARVRSFDAEATSGGGAQTYTWGPTASNPAGVKPGTYLYQSGTQPQVQVQMGLYGAVTKNAAEAGANPAEVYPGVPYANEATLLYSEIDPDLHAAVADGSYGTTGPTSTLNYTPRYFLINGHAFPFGAPVIQPAGNPGTTLLRLLNAGLTTHVPMIVGKYWNVVGEDGKPYNYKTAGSPTATPMSRTQYTALLPAAKTIDVLVPQQAGGPGLTPIVDRRLGLSNAGASGGGMLAYLSVGPNVSGGGSGAGGGGGGGAGSGTGTNQAPVAADDTYNSAQGVTLNIAAPGVLANDSDPNPGQSIMAVAVANGTTDNGGSYTLNANGSFIYAPAAGYTGASDVFRYKAADPHGALSNEATVTINLPEPGLPSLGSPVDDFNRADGPLGASWNQGNNTNGTPDVQIVSQRAQALTTDSGGLALWSAPFGAKQAASFESTALDGLGLVLKASGGTATVPANLIRVRRESANGGEVVVSTLIGSIGAPVYVRQAAFPAAGSGTLTASVDDKGLVLVWLGGAYLGGVQLPDVSVWKGTGKVGMQLQTIGGAVDNFSGATLLP